MNRNNSKPNLIRQLNTSSFLKTVQSSEINIISSIINKDKELDMIISKYLNLKRKINILLSKNY